MATCLTFLTRVISPTAIAALLLLFALATLQSHAATLPFHHWETNVLRGGIYGAVSCFLFSSGGTELGYGATGCSGTELGSGTGCSGTELRSATGCSGTKLGSGPGCSGTELRSGTGCSGTELRSGTGCSGTELGCGTGRACLSAIIVSTTDGS
eukprot:2394763-Rhodomonas_salina.1